MKPRLLYLALCLIATMGAVLTLFPAIGNATMTIMPLRVVFEDRDRSKDLTLANSSTTTNTYRMEWIINKMNPNGTYEKLSAPLDPAMDFSKSVIFSPRQVTIPPGEQQRIRLSLRRPADLPKGEYRAHLLIKKVDESKTRGGKKLEPDKVGAKVAVNFGFSIPVIVRVGATDAQATISDIKMQPGATPADGPSMTLKINRTGKHSVAGKIQVFWTPPGGQEEQIGILNNINVFTEITHRDITLALTPSKPVTSGTLRIVYEGIDEFRGTKFAETTLPIR